ncbi:LOW QUALITY PROTEIN: tolloid-like protein 1 [Xenia sp. Carnegie-2017]|uniref:LOW QUALITY PROTEIN: tolloid-like protein 1 n=1 Tax=Xenia sp. Carnegie-2017 TaxID=2897299 RepID=UPI001F04B2C0|nr:LOW QUALITY PROTEIN: tolloid-like protein 1 [Xenia sp. Carnegie-2017]
MNDCLVCRMLGYLVLITLHLSNVRSQQRLMAMDRIILANMGKEKLMNVDKFDIRLPPFRSDAPSGALNAAARDERKLWERGVVPYIIENSILNRPLFKANLQRAMKEWRKYTCIKFRKRKTDRDYVVFTHGIGCNADVGRKGGRQYVSLGRGCSDTGVIIHELGHVVGFWHEQNRPDRSKYVDIMWNNIIPNFRYAFDRYSTYRIDSRKVRYDFQSIMHYGKYAFSNNRKATIVARARNGISQFGNTHLSSLDVKQTNLVYNCKAKRRKFARFPEDFQFSASNIKGRHCVFLDEPNDPQFSSVWLCHKKTKRKSGIKWSYSGRLNDLICTQITDPNGEKRVWNDNYFCVGSNFPYEFYWSKNGTIKNLRCLEWTNSNRSFLCAKFIDGPINGGWTSWSPWTKCNRLCGGGYQEQRRFCRNPIPRNYGVSCSGKNYKRRFCNVQKCTEFPKWPEDFMFKYFHRTPYEHNCLRITNGLSDSTWRNYFFCSSGRKKRINMKWSTFGAQRDMRCININEPLSTQGWKNNYLCLPLDSNYTFFWSHSGSIDGLSCVKWFAKNGREGWNNNYLCGSKLKLTAAIPKKNNTTRKPIPIHGGWSEWSKWSNCSKLCGQGYQRRLRQCNQPIPSLGGQNCNGTNVENRTCRNSVCKDLCNNKVLTTPTGELTSPAFPNYPQNKRCQWLIRVAKGQNIELKFSYIRLKGKKSRCVSDHLIVRDGNNDRAFVLKLFCENSNSLVTINSSGNAVLLQLKTSDRLKIGGFRVKWMSKKSTNEVQCHHELTGNSGSIKSPLYPQLYPNNKDCSWLIIVPINRLLQIRFQDFKLEKHSKCSYDRLEVYDGGSLQSPKRSFCGDKNPGTITAFTNRFLIKFHSDASRSYRGFKLQWFTSKRRL